MKNRNSFTIEVLDFVKTIPRGRVSTYAGVARALGRPGAARAVGQVLKRNPEPVTIPCHRVVMSDGNLGGYTPSGTGKKRKLLAEEGIIFDGRKIDLHVFQFKP